MTCAPFLWLVIGHIIISVIEVIYASVSSADLYTELWCCLYLTQHKLDAWSSEWCCTTVKWMQCIWLTLKHCVTMVCWTECPSRKKVGPFLNVFTQKCLYLYIYSLTISQFLPFISTLSLTLKAVCSLYLHSSKNKLPLQNRTVVYPSTKNLMYHMQYNHRFSCALYTSDAFMLLSTYATELHQYFKEKPKTSPLFLDATPLIQSCSFLKQCDFVFLCNFLLMQCTICTVSQCNGYNICVWECVLFLLHCGDQMSSKGTFLTLKIVN